MPTDYRKMSYDRLTRMSHNGTLREMALVEEELARRGRANRARSPRGATRRAKPNEFTVHIQIQKLVDRTAAELTEVMARVVNEALGRIRTPRP